MAFAFCVFCVFWAGSGFDFVWGVNQGSQQTTMLFMIALAALAVRQSRLAANPAYRDCGSPPSPVLRPSWRPSDMGWVPPAGRFIDAKGTIRNLGEMMPGTDPWGPAKGSWVGFIKDFDASERYTLLGVLAAERAVCVSGVVSGPGG